MEKKRFKMYKKGKIWVVAPIVFLGLLGASAFSGDAAIVYADEASQESIIQLVDSEVPRQEETASSNELPGDEAPTEVVETPSVTDTNEASETNEVDASEQVDQSTGEASSNENQEATNEQESSESEEKTAPIEPTAPTAPSEIGEESQEDLPDSEASEVVEIPADEAQAEPQEKVTNEEKPAATAPTAPKNSTATPKVAPSAAPKAETKAAPAATIAIYRVYNPNSGEHLHTMNLNEKNYLVKRGWRYEGISMRVPLAGRQLFRIYNPNSGEHFFTLDGKERDRLKKVGWRYEGIAWHTPWAGMPMYRVFNPNSNGAGSHHYTMLLSERNMLLKNGWRNEGISWYTLGGAQPIAPVERLLNVPYVSQYVPVFSPWGCAGASMTMLLRYKGKNVDLKYVQDHLPMYPNDKGGQKGNVYTGAGFGWVITPDSLVNYAKKWYKNVSNISHVNTQNIVDRIINGNPILYYGYSSYQANTIRNHCKVIAGYKDNKFLVYDPLYYSSNAKAGSGGPNKAYDRGAMAWVSIAEFTKEWDGRAIGIS